MKGKWRERLELPRDVTEGLEIFRVMGNKEMYVHNYDKILLCTAERICFQCKRRIVIVTGKHLEIPFYTRDQMQVTGKIVSIQFE